MSLAMQYIINMTTSDEDLPNQLQMLVESDAILIKEKLALKEEKLNACTPWE